MCPVFVLAGAMIEARVWNNGTDTSSFSVAMHQQSPISVPSINIYRSAPVQVPSPTLHISSPLHPTSPNRKKLHRRSRRSKAQSTQHQHRLCPPRWVHWLRRLPPPGSPSLSISPSWYGQPKNQGSKHHHLAVRDPRYCGIQSGEYIANSPRLYRQPPLLVSNTWSSASFSFNN
jgi:hypothetical protein